MDDGDDDDTDDDDTDDDMSFENFRGPTVGNSIFDDEEEDDPYDSEEVELGAALGLALAEALCEMEKKS